MTTPKTRLLIVEDEEAHIEAIRRAFEESGVDVEIETARTLVEFRALTRERNPDLALMDLNLPDGRAVEALMNPPEEAPFPILVMTAYGDQRIVLEVMGAGALDYVVKSPAAFITMPRTVEHALHKWAQLLNHKRSGLALKASATRYRRLFEAAKDGILILDADTGEILDANPFLLELTGYSHGEFLGKHLWDFEPFQDIAASKVSFLKLQAQEYVRYDNLPLKTRDGRRIEVEFVSNVYRSDNQNVIQCNIRDITARKRTESELRYSNLILSTQQEASINGILVVDAEGVITSSNRQFVEMWDFSPGLLESRSDERVLQLVADQVENREEFIQKTKNIYANPGEKSQEDIALKDGRTLERSSAPMTGEDRNYFGRVWYFRDITLRKRADEALRQSEERFRILFEHAADLIFLLEISPERVPVIREANIQAFRILGYNPEELIGKPIHCIDAKSDSTQAIHETRRKNLYGTGGIIEVRHQRKDGTVLEFECSVMEMKIGSRILAISVERDITERKRLSAERGRLEEQLRVSQKMEAVGSLAGGIAHDFNNLLQVILSYQSFAMEGLREDDPVKEDLLEAKKAAERAAVLTRQLLAFSRKQVLQPVPLDLSETAAGLEKMLRRILGEDIDYIQNLAPSLGLTMADPGQIEQVLMNLVVNARDAMPEGGKLTVTTSNVEMDGEYLTHHPTLKPGPYVLLTVTDSGCGMDGPTKAKIFEPFFTTKEKGRGTGLGLSTVYGIVKQSGGDIWVYSEPGHGTTFKIYLPRDLTATAAAIQSLGGVPGRSTGTETIFLVEDEGALREAARRTLAEAGYRVLTAKDGEEALGLCEHHLEELHVLLTDVVMPGMGGRTLAQKLTERRPNLKVIYMSGYTDDAIIHHGVIDFGTHFLGKPFSGNDLKLKIREVLDGAALSLAGDQAPAIHPDARPENLKGTEKT